MNNVKDNYYLMFTNYPDIVSIEDLRVMLGKKNKKLGITTAYKLLKNKQIYSRKVGREYRIPKISVIEYVTNKNFD